MRKFKVEIWDKNEYDYPASYGFTPFIKGYLHEDQSEVSRGVMLVVPSGGYCMCMPHEGEPVAREFYDKGFDIYVLAYTTDITFSCPLKDQPLKDISRAVRFIRRTRKDAGISDEKLVVCGFSAGAHVCATLAVHYKDVKDKDPVLRRLSNRPDAVILSYPVITMGKNTHKESREALLGKSPDREDIDYYSAEKHVDMNTPPCFIWQTATDDMVPVKNSYLMAQALMDRGIPFAHYVFPFGMHGLSIGREIPEPEMEDDYAFSQLYAVVKALYEDSLKGVSARRIAELKKQFPHGAEGSLLPGDDAPPLHVVHYPDIAYWPELAICFLDGVL
jgi:acetyl esterase/lipase